MVLRPEDGEVILEPERAGRGYWVGAPGILYDPPERCWWLTYRRRRPRGENPDGLGDRGYLARVARSADGLRFEDVWEVSQRAWSTPSMERFSLVRDDVYRLYVSYVDPADNRWRIDLLEAAHPSQFDASALQRVLTADDVQGPSGERVEGVKDPWVFRVGATWHMLVSYAAGRAGGTGEHARLHETADVYTTGLITAPTGLATSGDGRRWEWQGRVLDPGPPNAWDRYQARLSSLVPLAGCWIGLYDGSASEQENYEERCGLAVSPDLRHWARLTPDHPAIVAPHGTGSIRYVEAVLQGGAVHCYYEYARPDGAHDLRRLVLHAT
ncbi:MAG: hypothetical protein JOZ41_17325 [Chloroflexi bacterium]|nr:hypothetical protein [Chloroflexota bacterium]